MALPGNAPPNRPQQLDGLRALTGESLAIEVARKAMIDNSNCLNTAAIDKFGAGWDAGVKWAKAYPPPQTVAEVAAAAVDPEAFGDLLVRVATLEESIKATSRHVTLRAEADGTVSCITDTGKTASMRPFPPGTAPLLKHPRDAGSFMKGEGESK
jgi:hypothetical protein